MDLIPWRLNPAKATSPVCSGMSRPNLASTARANSTASDLRGSSALVIEAVKGITDLVEDMHRNIASVSPIAGIAKQGRTKGVTGQQRIGD